MVWMVYLASILTYSLGQHIVVDALIVNIKGVTSNILLLINKVFVLVFVSFVVIGAVKFLPTVAIQVSPANRIVMAHVYIVIPISLFCIGVLAIGDIVKTALSFTKKDEAVQEVVL
jgi:TRAP-type C4-dicarboxylate transport system permease small subunit